MKRIISLVLCVLMLAGMCACQKAEEAPAPTDYSRFHKNSDFSLGYCTEVLIQLTVDDFDYAAFARALENIVLVVLAKFPCYFISLVKTLCGKCCNVALCD